MKRKGLIITTLLFFLLVNTTNFWEGKLGILAFPAFLFLLLVFGVLAFALLAQIFFAVREKFTDRQRLTGIVLLLAVLSLTLIFPKGLINFDRFEGKDVLIAEREGAANCTTTFKLKENTTFVERTICFGVSETKGNYTLRGDTLFFSNVQSGPEEREYYTFAVIKPSNSKNKQISGELLLYKSLSDTVGYALWITKNEFTPIKTN